MSLAAETREAVRNRPALYDALRAGIVNYTAAADSLDLDGDREAIATALRRFAAELEGQSTDTDSRSITVRLHSNVESTEVSDTLLAVDGAGVVQPTDDGGRDGDPTEIETGGQTAVRVTGEVDAEFLSTTVDRLRIAEISVAGVGVTGEAMVLLVARRDGPTAVQLVESIAESASAAPMR